jgi:RHH-type rel operon transcriptional repressor/antitoxin RelB
MFAMRLPPGVEKRLTRLAKKTGRTKSFYAREAIVEHLRDYEDLYLIKERLADIDEGRARLVPLEEAMRERNLL